MNAPRLTESPDTATDKAVIGQSRSAPEVHRGGAAEEQGAGPVGDHHGVECVVDVGVNGHHPCQAASPGSSEGSVNPGAARCDLTEQHLRQGVPSRPVRVRHQQGRPVRRLRAGRCPTHRRRSLGCGPTRQSGHGRFADAGAGRGDLVGHRIALHNQLLATLQHNFPGAIGLFSKLGSRISLAFLRRFPSEPKANWLTAGGGELRMPQWLKANSYCGRHTRRRLVDHPTNAAQGRTTVADASQDVATAMVEVPDQVADPSRCARGPHPRSSAGPPDGLIFQSLPRAGSIRSATLPAETGDCRARFPDAPPAWPPRRALPPPPEPPAATATSPTDAAATRTSAPP